MNRQLSMEFVRITEQAALLAGRLMGTGDKEGADQAAVDGMHQQFAKTPVSGTVVIGEGEIDEAPMLYIGEKVGQGGEEVDIAVDPVEGTNLVAKGKDGAIAVLAIAPKGCLLHAPDMYMQKICVGPRAKGCIDINASVTENLTRVAKAMDREISDLTIVVLDRERHEGIIREAREAGARIRLITDGDVVPSIDCGIQGSGIHMVLGSGGAPEGVLAAVGLKCLGGDMQAKLLPHTEEEVRRLHEMGITDPNKVLTLDDLVKGDDCIFSETAITDCAMLKGVRYFGGGARTSTLVLRYKTGTVRFVDTIHRFGEPDKRLNCKNFEKLEQNQKYFNVYWYDENGEMIAAGMCAQWKNDSEYMLKSFSQYYPSGGDNGQTFNYGNGGSNSGSLRDDYDNPEDLWADNQDWYEDEDEAWDEWENG